MSGLVMDAFGDFFGTTTQGGPFLRGTIYEISGGTEFLLYFFKGSDGEAPEGNLIMDGAGNLYGTTSLGGPNGAGTVFKYSSSFGSLIKLYSFGNYSDDGVGPAASLCLAKGVLYGTTTQGGRYRWGTVFSVNVKTQIETILVDFRGGLNGGTPTGGLVTDGLGNLYGTASAGGSVHGTAGNGVVFKLNIKSGKYSVLHTFTGLDGAQPTGPLTTDGLGNFFGTTFAGGTHGYGTVFTFNSNGTLTTLYNFTNGTDGANPYSGVILDSTGNIYGTATRGGQDGWGTLFEITPGP